MAKASLNNWIASFWLSDGWIASIELQRVNMPSLLAMVLGGPWRPLWLHVGCSVCSHGYMQPALWCRSPRHRGTSVCKIISTTWTWYHHRILHSSDVTPKHLSVAPHGGLMLLRPTQASQACPMAPCAGWPHTGLRAEHKWQKTFFCPWVQRHLKTKHKTFECCNKQFCSDQSFWEWPSKHSKRHVSTPNYHNWGKEKEGICHVSINSRSQWFGLWPVNSFKYTVRI